MSKYIVPFLSLTGALIGAQNASCPPEPPAPCYPDNCTRCYCLGPENIIANAPVCPMTCNGDLHIEVAGLYWLATEDGLEFAIDNKLRSPDTQGNFPTLDAILDPDKALNNLVDAVYEKPDFKWDYGFKLGISYCTPCDGWDIRAEWTWFRGKANSHLQAEQGDNHTLLPLWSAFATFFPINFSFEIESNWKSEFNIVDIELGRKFWTSHYLAFRPHIGIRTLFIDQNCQIQHKGGSYGPIDVTSPTNSAQGNPLNDRVNLTNDYKGVGLRGGFDTAWHFGCGFSAFGEIAASIIYGRFNLHHTEELRFANLSFRKRDFLKTKESLRAARSVLDMAAGIEWGGLICDCKYGIDVSLAWEQHVFFHQNQLWRVDRIGNEELITGFIPGENDFEQRQGTLTTQGVTLKFGFTY